MPGRSAKRKGSGYEREVVALLQEHGIAAERVPLSGAVKGGSFEGDINCPVRGADTKIECKRWKGGFRTLRKALGPNNYLFHRDDGCETLVTMTWREFVKLAK